MPTSIHSSMTKHLIGTNWSLLTERGFRRQICEGDVMLWIPGRTIYAGVYNTNNSEAEEAIQKMIEGRPGVPVQMFDREEPALAGHAYLLPEGNKNHRFWGLNTWTAARGSVACVTIYFYVLNDLDWAIRVWKSVRPREGKPNMN